MGALASTTPTTDDSTQEEDEAEIGSGDQASRERQLVWLGLVLTLVPLAVAAVHQLFWVGADYYPNGDVALTELRTRDVGRHMLWLGPYSRDGWYHPGPILFYVLVLPYRLLGSSGNALAAAGLLVNGASVAGMVWLARRRGGIEMALATLLVCALLLRALGWEFLQLPWNVYITVLPYGLLVFLVWAMARGERWALPVATLVTTFLVQTHIGYILLAVPLLAVGAAWLVGSTLRQAPTELGAETVVQQRLLHQARRARRSLAPLLRPGVVALAVGVVLWLPPVVQQLREDRGNLGLIVDWFRDSGDEMRSLFEGWRVVAAQYVVWPEWLAGAGPVNFVAEPLYVYERVVPVLLVVVLAAARVWWRRRDPAARPLAAVWLGASVLGVVAAARTVGLLYLYRLRWTWMLGAIGGLLVVWLALRLVRDRGGPRAWQVGQAGVMAGLAVLGVVGSVTAVRSEVPTSDESELISELAPALRDELARAQSRRGDVVIAPQSFGAIGIAQGVVLDLERHGIATRLAEEGRDDDRVRARVALVIDDDIPGYDDGELLAYSGRVSLGQLTEDVATLEELQEELAAGTMTVQEHNRRSRELVPGYGAAALFLLDR